MASRYVFAFNRPGWDFTGLTRQDLPPNDAGFRYTEFRRANGELHTVVRTSLLIEGK